MQTHPRSKNDNNTLPRTNLEDTNGWGARWQQGGNGGTKWGHFFVPHYSQGMGDRERYIGYLKTNPLQYYPNRSHGINSDKPLPDHTRPWGKRRREILCKPIGYFDRHSFATGFLDESGNDRGRLQRWPMPEKVPNL
jgi:hypothetical protein